MTDKKQNHAAKDHGTIHSYIVGFVLSLVLTAVPYFLVVNHVLSGTALLVTILGIALLQMTVQIVFFLHLGRGPKPLYNIVFFFATAGMICLVLVASLLIMSNLYRNMSPGEVIRTLAQKENISQVGGRETGACQGNKDNHIITISRGVSSPNHIEAKRCDTLTFINQDAPTRELTFGIHPAQQSYGGEYEVVLERGEPETITLNQTGDFVFHDHHDPAVTGNFTVSSPTSAED